MTIIHYDLRFQPPSLGDVLVFAACASVCVAGPANFVFTYDPDQPVVKDPAFRNINGRDALLNHLSRIVDAPKVAHVVDGTCLAVRLPEENGGVWPESQGEYLNYKLHEWLSAHYRETGRSPWLTAGLSDRPGDYISVNLRENQDNPERNSKIPAWDEFFQRHPDEIFVTVGDVAFDLPNVVHHRGENALHDLALIERSRFHMGTASGPCEMAKFGTKPYAVFCRGTSEEHTAGFCGDRWEFASPDQLWVAEPETLANLERHYERMRAL